MIWCRTQNPEVGLMYKDARDMARVGWFSRAEPLGRDGNINAKSLALWARLPSELSQGQGAFHRTRRCSTLRVWPRFSVTAWQLWNRHPMGMSGPEAP